jgi:hypothetical protein
MCRRGSPSLASITAGQYGCEARRIQLALAHQQQRTDNVPHHMAQKRICSQIDGEQRLPP